MEKIEYIIVRKKQTVNKSLELLNTLQSLRAFTGSVFFVRYFYLYS